jgi:hypothetical protein
MNSFGFFSSTGFTIGATSSIGFPSSSAILLLIALKFFCTASFCNLPFFNLPFTTFKTAGLFSLLIKFSRSNWVN